MPPTIDKGYVRTAELVPKGISWDEPVFLPYLDTVSKEIQRVVSLFDDCFEDTESRLLCDLVSQFHDCFAGASFDQKMISQPGRMGSHRQSSNKASPIYAALDPDTARGDEGDEKQLSVERFVRFILLCHLVGKIRLGVTIIGRASRLTRTLRYKGRVSGTDDAGSDLEVYQEFGDQLLRFIRARDWPLLAAKLNEMLDDATFKQHRASIETLIELIRYVKDVGPTSSRVNNIFLGPGPAPSLFDEDEEPPLGPIAIDIASDDFDDAGVALSPVVAGEAEHLGEVSEQTAKVLAVRGNNLHMVALWSGQSSQALLAPEARACMDWLLKFQPEDHVEELARLFWVLTGVSSHRYDNLMVGSCADISGLDPKPRLAISLQAQKVKIEFEILNSRRFDTPADEANTLFLPCSSTMRLMLRIPFTVSEAAWLALQSVTAKKEDEFLQSLLKAKKRIKDLIRKQVCDKFLENRFRATLLQVLFSQTQDLPFIQMLCCEELYVSSAALHYIALSPQSIQSRIGQALESLYGEGFVDSEPPEGDILIGAPTSAVDVAVIRAATRRLVPTDIVAPKGASSVANIVARHQQAAIRLAWVLLFGTANRNLKDLRQLSLAQMSLEVACAILEDKASDPSIFRRVVILAPFVIGEIKRYIHHLRSTKDALRKFRKTPALAPIINIIEAVLVGESALLFCIELQGDGLWAVEPLNTRALIKEQLGQAMPADIPRHLMASQMRELNLCRAALIEIQLGHNIGYDIFGEHSVVAMPLLAEALQAPLTRYLEHCGFPVQDVFEYQPGFSMAMNLAGCGEWPARVRAIYKDDTLAVQRMLDKSNTLPASMLYRGIRQVIDEQLCCYCQVTDLKGLPDNVQLNEEQCKALYRAVLCRIDTSQVQILSAAAGQLKRVLKQLNDEKGWAVCMPPPVYWNVRQPIALTRYHLKAYDWLNELRARVKGYWRRSATAASAESYALVMVLFGGASSIEEAYELLKRGEGGLPSPDKKALLIDVGDDPKESRTLTGAPLAALLGWQSCGEPLPSKARLFKKTATLLQRLISELDTPLPMGTLNALVTMARAIEVSPLFAGIGSETVSSRSMTSHRLRQLLADSGENRFPDPDALSKAREQEECGSALKSRPAKNRREERVAYRQLREAIENPRSQDIAGTDKVTQKPLMPRTQSSRAVWAFLRSDTAQVPQITHWLARWSIKLLAAHSKRRGDGGVMKNTVLSYLSVVSMRLIPAFAGTNIYNMEREELFSAIDGGLSKEPRVRNKQVGHLNRLFADTAEEMGLPRLAFGVDNNPAFAKKAIDPSMITRRESELVHEQLVHWSKNRHISAATQETLATLSDYLIFIESYPIRRSEGRYLRSKDVSQFQDTCVISIRETRKRGLKSKAAKRAFTGAAQTLALPSTWMHASDSNSLIFPALSQIRLGYDSFSPLHYALKQATGNPRARSHRYRATSACKGVTEVVSETSVLARIQTQAKVAARMGHVSIATTITHYCPIIHHLLGSYYCVDMQVAGTPFISRLLRNRQISTYKQQTLWGRALPRYEKTVQDHLPAYLVATQYRPAAVIDFIYKIVSLKDYSIKENTQLGRDEIIQVLDGIHQAQLRLGFDVIGKDKLDALLEDPVTRNTGDVSKKRRLLSKAVFDRWQDGVIRRQLHVPDLARLAKQLRTSLQGLRIRQQDLIIPILNESEYHYICLLIESMALPIALPPYESKTEIYTLKTETLNAEINPQSAQSTLRALLIAVIAFEKLALSNSQQAV